MMITEIADYFGKGCGRCDRFATPDCATQRWSDGLSSLRAMCRNTGLTEMVKWGHPCYMHAARNIAIIGAFRDNFRLTFFDAGLMQDPHGILQRRGKNTAQADMLVFTDNAAPAAQSAIIVSYLQEAMGYAKEGRKPARRPPAEDLPDALVDALDADPALADAFHALTPGRRRGYALHIGGAKQAATRHARVAKCRDRIFAGKGFNER